MSPELWEVMPAEDKAQYLEARAMVDAKRAESMQIMEPYEVMAMLKISPASYARHKGEYFPSVRRLTMEQCRTMGQLMEGVA